MNNPTSISEILEKKSPSLFLGLSKSNTQNKKSVRNLKFHLDNDAAPTVYQELEQNKTETLRWNNEKEDKIFISKIFTDHGFPKRPNLASSCKSKNGENILEMISTAGLPYGHDKDLVYLICIMAINNHERELYFPSKADLLREMGKTPHSDTTKRVIESLYRLRNTTFIFHEREKSPFEFQLFESVNLVKQSVYITISQEFYDHLTEKKTTKDPKTNKTKKSLKNTRPIDRRMIKELMNNRIALDTYTFSSFRVLGGQAKMNVLEFMNQINTGFQSAKQFTKTFTEKITRKIGRAFKKVYNMELPTNLFFIKEQGKGHRKSFTLFIKGECQLVPPLTS